MQSVPIAVVGMGVLFPGSTDLTGFWSNILRGRDLTSDVPASHWLIDDYYDPDPAAKDKTYCKRGAFLPSVEFDTMAFGVPPNIVQATDTAQLLALLVAQKVLDDAGETFKSLDRDKISVILGVTSGQELLSSMVSRLQRPVWIKALRQAGIPEAQAETICEDIAASYVNWQPECFPGLLGNVVAGRIANRFDLHGTNCVTDAACASALSALSMGLNELALGQSDLVITGGVDTMNDILMYMCFSKTQTLSLTGDCRPFSSAADGTLLGEGIAMLALRRLEDAERDGDQIYAVIRGLGSSSDGRNTSVYAPLPEGQARALRRAYERAGYGPETVELVEAHGTATVAGDVAEFEGLRQVFGSDRHGPPRCALGSVKSQIGHTKASAGVAGLVKAILALHHKVLPPTIKVEKPNPKLELECSPFYLNTEARPWIRDASHLRRASVSSFGFGGSNFHVTLEEHPAARGRLRALPSELIAWSGASAAALAKRCREHAIDAKTRSLTELARSSQATFRPTDPARLALVASDRADLIEKLEQAAVLLEGSPSESFSTPSGIHFGTGAREGLLAFLFPGQGSQRIGMGSDLAMAFEAARAAWDQFAGLHFDGLTLQDVVYPPPVWSESEREAQRARLTETQWTQPALGLTSLSMLRLLEALGLSPDCVAGHSFGEISALCAAGAIREEDCLRIARRRGELMREASGIDGAMCAVALSPEALSPIVAQFAPELVVANHNHPEQVVLSGPTASIAAIEAVLAARSVTVKRLSVETAFHSSLMQPASAQLADALEPLAFEPPRLDVYSNLDAAVYGPDPRETRARLVRQLVSPVRFADEIEAMWTRGVRTFVEVGPGATLSECVDRILGERPHRAIPLDRKGKNGVTSFHDALARVAVSGIQVDFGALWAGYAAEPASPRKPSAPIVINGANYGKPYPAPNAQPARPARVEPARPAEPLPQIRHESSVVRSSGDGGGAMTEDQLVWLKVFQETQQNVAAAHTSYQHTMAASHEAFLKTVEGSYAALSSVLTSQPSPATQDVGSPSPRARVETAPLPANGHERTNGHAAVSGRATLDLRPEPEPIASAPPAVDLEQLMLSIVAQKTGYPVDMLGLHMELEADLGVDSIKRVEILSNMRERVPNLPELEPSELAALRSLGQVVDYMRAHAPSPTASVAAPSVAPRSDLAQVMLSVVADKTGYPVEMLGLHMDLEADLGVDSIKRVEILSKMRELVPGLPEVAAAELAALRTLGQVVDYMQAGGSSSSAAAAAKTRAEPAAVTSETAAASECVERTVVRSEPQPLTGLALTGLSAGSSLVITSDGNGVAEALARALGQRGIAAEVVSAVPADARGVIFLGGLREIRSIDEALAVNTEAFAAAQAVARRLASEGGVCVMVQDTGGELGAAGADPLRAWLAGLAALARTAALEWPKAGVKTIELVRAGQSPDALAARLATELLQGGCATEIVLHADGTRRGLRSVAAATQRTSLPVDANSVVVISGGARGVTAAVATAFAARTRASIALLGRTPLADEPTCCRTARDDAELKHALNEQARAEQRALSPAELRTQVNAILANREIRTTLAAIERAGSRVRYCCVDVRDALRLGETLDAIRADWGPVTGLVHAAGVLADKLIADKTPAQFAQVFDTKVLGLRALLRATEGDPLAFLALFSSVAARTGNPGQSDYAMANEILNAVAASEHRRRGGSCVVKSIGWGPWDGGMVSPALRSLFQQRNVPLISLEQGARSFIQELESSPDEVVSVIGANLGEVAVTAIERQAVTLEAHVDSAHSYLLDHRIAGTVVVPVALAVDWFVRAARDVLPHLRCTEIRDLKVLKGIKLPRFGQQSESFRATCHQLSAGGDHRLAVELRSRSGELHYTAHLQVLPNSVALESPVVPALRLEPWSRGEIYDGEVLFHGAKLRAIRAIEGISNEGIAGTLAGARELGWNLADAPTDPAVFDGAMQLAVLWATHVLGGATLPMAVQRYRLHDPAPSIGPVRCVVRGRKAHSARAVCDVYLIDAAGVLLGELSGVETVLRPDAVSKSVSHAV